MEERVYAPGEEFVRRAHVQGMDAYQELYARAKEKPEEFWGELAEKELFWFEKWSNPFEWAPPFVKWFAGGKTNASYNCLDRHLATPRANKVAILWEGEPGDQRMISYRELHRLVCRFANVLKSRGLKAGDRAIIYMPMIPELPVAMLAIFNTLGRLISGSVSARLGRTQTMMLAFLAFAVGLKLPRIWATVWAAAGVVALVAGLLWGARLGVQFSLSLVVLKALPVLVLGGFDSILGAIVAGLLIGATEKLAEVYIGPFFGGGIESWFAYLVALAFLLVRPAGLFGQKFVERA